MPQLAITCLKLTTETLEQGVKDIQSQQQRHHNDAWLQLKTSFTPCSSVSIVNFEQVNANWGDWTNFESDNTYSPYFQHLPYK